MVSEPDKNQPLDQSWQEVNDLKLQNRILEKKLAKAMEQLSEKGTPDKDNEEVELLREQNQKLEEQIISLQDSMQGHNDHSYAEEASQVMEMQIKMKQMEQQLKQEWDKSLALERKWNNSRPDRSHGQQQLSGDLSVSGPQERRNETADRKSEAVREC